MHSAGVDLEHREVLLKDKPQALVDVSPKATVPVLLLNDAHHTVLEESLDIMRWALAENDPESLDAKTLDHVLVAENDAEFKPVLDRYKYFDRHPEHPQSFYLDQAKVYLAKLEQQLNSHDGAYLLSNKLSAVDLAIFPFIRQFAFADKAQFDALEFPRLQQWLARLLDSQRFAEVMTKYPVWQPN